MAENESLSNESQQMSLQEQYLENLEDLEEGQLIEGTIIEITPDTVFIDVGYKSEGKIPLEEFKEKPEMGAVVQVILVKKEGRSGQIVVSKQKADVKVYWKELREAFEEKRPVEGTFAKAIKGGFEVDLGYGFRAFCPMSKADVRRVEDPESYVGRKVKFLLDRLYSDNKVKIVVSRRNYLETAITEARSKFFSEVQIGDEVDGVVKSFTSFGAFIDLGGFDGLLHINDMSWGHVTRPKDYVKKDQEIKLRVIKLDHDNQKINLSLKHFTTDPWNHFEDKYNVEDVVPGKVTKLTDFGAFIELEEGIEGLAHISEMSWVKRIKHPSEIVSIGDTVDCKILAYDIRQGRVSLGLKQVLDNPWDNIAEKYPVGTRLAGTIRKVTNSGAFVDLEDGIEGFLHADDLSWTRKVKNPSSVLKKDEEIDVMVIEADSQSHRIRLGVKQLSEDPWETLEREYPRGSGIEGEVTSVTDFGVFVKVPGGIEGLINKHNLLLPNQEDDPDEVVKKFNKGDKVKALVTEINRNSQRLYLSIREYHRSLQREELSKYIHDEEDESTFTLGDFLKNDEGEGNGESAES